MGPGGGPGSGGGSEQPSGSFSRGQNALWRGQVRAEVSLEHKFPIARKGEKRPVIDGKVPGPCLEKYTIRTRPAVGLRPCYAGGIKHVTSLIKKLARRLQKRIRLREREIA